MTTYRHTVNLAFGLNIVVYDDQGNLLDEFIFPFALFFFTLPGVVYGLLRSSLFSALAFASAFFSPSAWRADLTIIAWAARLLIVKRRFAYA